MVRVAIVLSNGHKRKNIRHIWETRANEVSTNEILEVEISCEKTGKSFSCPYIFNKENEMDSEIHYAYCPYCGKKLVKKKEKVTLKV